MHKLHNTFNSAMDQIIETKLDLYAEAFDEKIATLEKQLKTAHTNPFKEILQQKEVLELLGIGRRRLKNWVDRGLYEIRVDNRVYYRYSDLMNFIEGTNN